MGPLDALWHLCNLLAPGFGVSVLAAAAAKLIWRKDLRAVPWRSLAWPACAANSIALLAGLAVFGRDGTMATYGLMVAACTLMLWWRGFGPGAR
jgi:hypothetical protein